MLGGLGGGIAAIAAGGQGQSQGKREQQCNNPFHFSPPKFFICNSILNIELLYHKYNAKILLVNIKRKAKTIFLFLYKMTDKFLYNKIVCPVLRFNL